MRSGRSRFMMSALVVGALAIAGCSAGSTTQPTTEQNTQTSTAGPGSTSQAPGQSGSSAPSGSTGAAPSDASLTIGFVLEPASLDFTQVDGAAIPQLLLTNVYETLVKLDQNGKIVPSLADKWTVSPDGKTYTFELHPGVKFSNGAPFTAEDAKFSIERVKTGWKPAVKAAMDVVDTVTATSSTELTVKLKQPSNSWLWKMTSRIGAMFSKDGVANLATKPIGTGPYAFQTWNRGDSIVLQRNPSYWGPAPSVKTVTFKYFKDATAMDNALLTGGIQVISTEQNPEALSQFDTSKYQIIDGNTDGKVMMTLNNGKAPLNDKRVRQAINYAIDKEAIVKAAWAGYGKPLGSHESPNDPWFEDLSGKYPHDVAKAKQLLADAGQSDLKLSLKLPPPGYAKNAAPIIISELKEAGITVTATDVTFPVWLDQVFGKADYDMTIINHVEPRDVATVFGSAKADDYYTRYTNPEVVKLLADGDAGTPDEYIADNKKVVEILADDAAAAWLWSFPNLMVADKDVQGLPKNQVGEAFVLTNLSVG